MPFSLYASAQRRKQIMASMMDKGPKRQEGEKILNNYKKHLTEKMAERTLKLKVNDSLCGNFKDVTV